MSADKLAHELFRQKIGGGDVRALICVYVGLILVAAALAVGWVDQQPPVTTYLGTNVTQLVAKIPEWLANGAVAFFALAFYTRLKLRTEEGIKFRERETQQALFEIDERIPPAIDAVEALRRIQSQRGGDLPHDGVTPFSNIASFCASWIQPKRRRWCDANMQTLLVEANYALFAFVVELEVRTNVVSQELSTSADAAVKALKKVAEKINERT